MFALHAARHLVAHARDAHGRRSPAVRALRRFLRRNGESADEPGVPLGSRLAQSAKGLQTSLSLEAFGVKAGLDLAQAPSEGAHAARQLEVVEQGVARAFDELGCDAAHEPLFLMVDQLEQVWSAETDSNSMVIGLLLAARHGTERAVTGGCTEAAEQPEGAHDRRIRVVESPHRTPFPRVPSVSQVGDRRTCGTANLRINSACRRQPWSVAADDVALS
ncbi:hypothetical protein AB5J52_35060 [Streptomyces sp. R39]|uniref:ATP-binding protein n=1 Tax=Streptomyces sp. R39 TaxID=3238631 RepID=A0AB39QTX3_9ACTN